jgi:hypothetical protein
MFDAVASALLIHLGKKGVDWLWSELNRGPVISQNTGPGYAASGVGRTRINRNFTPSRQTYYENLFGNFYIPYTIGNILCGSEVFIVLLFDQMEQQVLLFEADIGGYDIELPYGNYYSYVFLMDGEDPNFFDAEIYAVGFPCARHIDLSHVENFETRNIWGLVDSGSIRINRGGPFVLDFIMIDTYQEQHLPQYFSEICR